MRVFRPLPRGLSRSLSALVVLAWLGQMGLLYRSIQASSTNLASDLSRYGQAAQWRGLFARAGMTPREVTLLRGLARQILWAAGRIARTSGGER